MTGMLKFGYKYLYFKTGKKGDIMKRKTKKILETIGYVIGAVTVILLIYGIVQVALK